MIYRIFLRCNKKLLELINEFNTVAVYEINMQKSILFLYINSEIAEKEI